MASCVVTGAAMGAGRAIALALLADGHHVAGVDWDADALDATAGALGAAFEPLHGDVGDWETHERAADLAERAAPLAGWVNNAGIDIQGGAHEVTPEEIAQLDSMELEELQYHNMAYLNNSPDKELDIEDYLLHWRRGTKDFRLSILPLYYSENGYSKDNISDLKSQGLLPVEWKVSPPKKRISEMLLSKYIMSRLIYLRRKNEYKEKYEPKKDSGNPCNSYNDRSFIVFPSSRNYGYCSP